MLTERDTHTHTTNIRIRRTVLYKQYFAHHFNNISKQRSPLICLFYIPAVSLYVFAHVLIRHATGYVNSTCFLIQQILIKIHVTMSASGYDLNYQIRGL